MRIAIVQRMGVFIHGLPRWIALVLLEQKARGAVLEQNVRRFPQYVEFALKDGTCPIKLNGKLYLRPWVENLRRQKN